MKIYDISMMIGPNMMVYKNNPMKKPKLINSGNFEKNNHYETDITMNMHTGTHIDAPLHMLRDGSTMEIYDIERYVVQAKVFDLTHKEDMIKEEDLKDKSIYKGDFILLKTKNSFDTTFNNEFVFLEASGAKYLCNIGIRGIGIDSLGIERSQPSHITHTSLLSKNIMIVEGLMLKDIEEGDYQLIVLPLKIKDVEAAPARAILIEH